MSHLRLSIASILVFFLSAWARAAPATQPAANPDTQPAASLADLSGWEVRTGQWKMDDHHRIIGTGESSLLSKETFPPDGDFSFTLSVIWGMRPRITFEGTELMVGNEGFARHIEAYGAASIRAVRFLYKLNQPMDITVKFRGRDFELWINNELWARGKRKAVPESIRIKLSAGDGWSAGICEFSNFAYHPADKGKP